MTTPDPEDGLPERSEPADGRPDRGDPFDGLPGLPPEWGRIVIPDDPAALAAEADAVRRELRDRRPRRPGDPRPVLGHRRAGGRHRSPDTERGPDTERAAGRTPAAGPNQATDRNPAAGPAGAEDLKSTGSGHRPTDPTAHPEPLRYAPTAAVPRLPLLVLVIAVLATLASFLAAMWPGQSRPAPGQSRETAGRRPVPVDPAGRNVPALDLVDETGSAVALRSLLPAVILLVEECACPTSVTAAISAVPPGVTVIVVSSNTSTPSPLPTELPAGGTPVRSLADPAGGLRRFLRAPAEPGEAPTLLVGRSGEIVRLLPAPTSIHDYQAELPRLLAPA